MPLYFFHTHNGHHHADQGGSDLADMEAAKGAAVQILSEMLHGAPRSVWDTEAMRIICTDHTGARLFRLELCGIMEPPPGVDGVPLREL